MSPKKKPRFDVANVECDFFLSSRQRAAMSKSEAGLLYLELVCASEREMFDLHSNRDHLHKL